jgi:hypothetical protein
VAGRTAGDVADARAIAFAPAQAVVDDHATLASRSLGIVAEMPALVASDVGKLVNVLSALQFAVDACRRSSSRLGAGY